MEGTKINGVNWLRWAVAAAVLSLVPPIAVISTGYLIGETIGSLPAARAVIVLGNAVLEDGTASVRLAARARVGVRAAVEVASRRGKRENGGADSRSPPLPLVFTGGEGTHPPSEAAAAMAEVAHLLSASSGDDALDNNNNNKNHFDSKGTPVAGGVRAIAEAQSTSTLENLAFARVLVSMVESNPDVSDAELAAADDRHAGVVRERPDDVVASAFAVAAGNLHRGSASKSIKDSIVHDNENGDPVLVVTDAFHAWRARELCRMAFPSCGVVVVDEDHVFSPTWLWREIAWASRESVAIAWHTLCRARGIRPDTGLRVNFPF